MSMNDSVLVVASAAQDVANAAVAVVGKGGFSANETFGQIIEFQLTGLLVVFTVLGGLTIMLYLLAWILRTVAPDQYYCRPKAAAATKTAPALSAVVATQPVASAIQPATSSIHPGLSDDELVAILAVAASEGFGQPVSIVRFRPMDSMDWTWSVQGRVNLHASRAL